MAPVETSPFERNQPRRCPWLGAGLVGIGLLAFASPAGAFPEAPGIVQEALGLSCAPPCMLCHDTPAGGLGTATQPFVLRLSCFVPRAQLTLGNIPTALAGLETQPCRGVPADNCMSAETTFCDTDADGAADVEELKAKTNPNPGGSDLACPEYGCGARIAPARSGRSIDGTAALAAFGTLVLLASRWRRR
jgi:hypothetical protein